mmetsp:Transcript_21048/g.83940  ORF Transcript_21048/g.83940 Transcript_21048/m.83940 type:complete len:233 (-) Transcript_21048:33-731(-)
MDGGGTQEELRQERRHPHGGVAVAELSRGGAQPRGRFAAEEARLNEHVRDEPTAVKLGVGPHAEQRRRRFVDRDEQDEGDPLGVLRRRAAARGGVLRQLERCENDERQVVLEKVAPRPAIHRRHAEHDRRGDLDGVHRDEEAQIGVHRGERRAGLPQGADVARAAYRQFRIHDDGPDAKWSARRRELAGALITWRRLGRVVCAVDSSRFAWSCCALGGGVHRLFELRRSCVG